jgi:AhpC/TSA family
MLSTSIMGPLLLRQLISPITARTADGAIVRAWDFKQKRNLVIAFPHADCTSCATWLSQLAERAADLSEREAVGLVIYAETPPRLAGNLEAPFIVAGDVTGNSQRAFLGREAFGPAGLDRVGVFVTDRYGELYAQWAARDAGELPVPAEIFSALWQIQVAC